ncbi:MAG: formylglycine-generating enzyme family protein [Verrucomicrobia bacterium]|nr:formylglycine-generating enzyme family protein [Verrucomicrobiota bacterium]
MNWARELAFSRELRNTGSRAWLALLRCGLLMLVAFFLVACDRRSSGPANQTGTASSVPARVEPVPMTNMVLIKAGTFLRLRHPVTLSRDFWLGKYEVTQRQFEEVMGKNPSHFKDDPNGPVEKVSYFDAVAYCSVLTKLERESGRLPVGYEYRLPTEAEWEYACRAGTTNFFSFGDTVTNANQYAWTWENSEDRPHPVGQKLPNPWGLHDIHGNVWEWCLDWFGNFPEGPVQDPSGPPAGKLKVFRGGGWNNEIKFARSANRFMMAPSNGIYFVGFRVALGHTSPPRNP